MSNMMIKSVIPVYWHRSINFGDQLTPYIVEKLTGEQVVYCDHLNACKRLMVTGSILADPDNVSQAVIWGNGFCYYADPVYKPAEIKAVRGKLTHQMFVKNDIPCPEVFGDPGLLMPVLYSPKIERKQRFGIMPHIVDYDQAAELFAGTEYKVIDLRLPIEQVIDQMLECESIFSSSLHGIIVANAYNMPAAWIKFSDKIIGDNFKFHDYYSAVLDGEFPTMPTKIGRVGEITTALMLNPGKNSKLNLLNLLKAFPLTIKQEIRDAITGLG